MQVQVRDLRDAGEEVKEEEKLVVINLKVKTATTCIGHLKGCA